MVVLPISAIEGQSNCLNVFCDEDGNVYRWHIAFFLDITEKMVWMLSRLNIEEIDINISLR